MDSTPGCSETRCAELREKGLCGVRQFGDRVCGYRGPEGWCDRSRARCEELGNLERFDGAMPPLRKPWEGKWWQIVGTLGMLATMAFEPHWMLAASLYTLFSCMIIPHVRRELYLGVDLRRQVEERLLYEQEQEREQGN